MTSSGTTTKYMNRTNLYNHHQGDYTANTNFTTPRRPQRTTRLGDDTDGEDEKKLLSLSERIKKLSASRVLKDNSILTHNNNEPFTYLRSPDSKPVFNKPTPLNKNTTIHRTGGGREVIYAQVVVDPEDKKDARNFLNKNQSTSKNKRTVHRSYNNNNYESETNRNSGVRMKGRNVTTVLLNSSSDDIPSSLNFDERIGSDSRFRSSSSPLLANDGYYPKSPGIVKHFQNQNGYTRSRYDNHLQKSSTDYLHNQSDEDDYFKSHKYETNSKYRYDESRDRSPFGRDGTDYSDDYNYQPVNYGGKSSSFMDYSKKSSNTFKNEMSYKIDEEDEYDVTRNTKFEDRRSKTLDRDGGGFSNYKKNLTSADFINRSKTLDNRLSSLKERSRLLNENRVTNNDPYDFKLTTATNQELGSRNLTLNRNKPKDKSTGGGNIFSTLLRRSNTKKPEQKSQPVINKGVTDAKKAEKKTGQNTNFFTSFLEKKRKKQLLNADLKTKKGQAQKVDNNTSTYQSYRDWPTPVPPSLNVVDYSDLSPTGKPFYGESNIDTEDSNAHASDIWKKSYGNDLTKVKRRWTMREPSKPSVIREEEDLTTRTLGRKPYLDTPSRGITSGSIDRRKTRTYSADRSENYNSNKTRYCDESDSFLKVPGPKYNTIDTRYSPEKSGYKPQKYEAYEPPTTGYSNNNTLTKRGRTVGADKTKGYTYGGGTPNSSGSESNNRNTSHMVNGSLRSVYLHEPAVISEMPRTTASSGGGGASISGLSGRRTLSKDEISNYSGPRKETKQLSRSMSLAHPWGPNKLYRDKYRELDYSQSNNRHLPPIPPSRSPSGSMGVNSRPSGESSRRLPAKPFSSITTKLKTQGISTTKGPKFPGTSSSVESLLRQDTPDEAQMKKKGNSKLGRSKSISVPQSTPRDGKNSRFSTLWFNKRNANK